MNILVDARPLVDPSSGGVGRVARELVAAYVLAFPDDRITCVTTGSRKPELPAPLARTNVSHLHLNIPNKLWSALCMLNLISLVDKVERRIGKIDAVFYPNLGFIGKRGTRNSALLLHDLSFLIEPSWFSLKARLWHRAVNAKEMIRSSKRLLAVSETTKRDAVRLLGIPEERISAIPIGPTPVGANGVRPRLTPLTPTKKYVLALGGNNPRKNSATAVEAVRELKNQKGFEDVELILIGNAHPSDSELASLYANASAFLYPSWYEGYGLPVHEAARFGTPIIASTSSALPETAPAGTVFANPAKPHHWVEALRYAFSIQRTHVLSQDPERWMHAARILRESLRNP